MVDDTTTCDRSDHDHDSLDQARACARHADSPVTCDLTGNDGNAFAVMGRATRAMKAAGVPKAAIDAYRLDAMSGDYDGLLAATMRHLDLHEIAYS